MDDPRPPECTEAGLPPVTPLTEDDIAAIGKALAHPARVKIIEQFREHRPHMVHEIVEGCDLAQSTVSEHLRILREADVVFATKDGPRTWYCLRRSVLDAFAAAVHELSSELISIERRWS
jgi:ArsR family transcriptional regulator